MIIEKIGSQYDVIISPSELTRLEEGGTLFETAVDAEGRTIMRVGVTKCDQGINVRVIA